MTLPNTIGIGIASRKPITDITIEPHLEMQGSNYAYITFYGTYIWLQPLNILKVLDVNGQELIHQSVFVLQENSSGTWLSLLDFADITVQEATDSKYVLTYKVQYRYRGTWYHVADVTLTFDLEHSLAKPKLSVSVEKTADWNTVGLGDARWIWDVVPNASLEHWVDTINKQAVELPSNKLIDLVGFAKGYLTQSDSYIEQETWLEINCEDSENPPQFQGGKEPYWNSRGVVTVFPANQLTIDPSTVATGYSASATAIEQQRKVFHNPRGQQYYYAIIEVADGGWRIYKSANGVSWEYTSSSIPSIKGSPDWWIYSDASNSRLLIYICYLRTVNEDGWVRCYSIPDTSSDATTLWDDSFATETEDGVHNPSITLDDDGYIWVAWVDEFTNKGKQRAQIRVIRSTTPYPTSTPSWETIVNIYGASGSSEHPDGLYAGTVMPKPELVPLTATDDVACVIAYHDQSVGSTHGALLGIGLYYSSGIQEDATVTLDGSINVALLCSSVAETGSNSDVFVLYFDSSSPYVKLVKWDISEDSASAYGTVSSGTNTSPTLALGIDKTSSPNKLVCFYVRDDYPQDIYYDVTPVDSFSLEGATEVDDGASENLDYMSSSYEDWNGDSKVQVIYTRQTNYTVRFHEVEVGVGVTEKDFSDSIGGSDTFAIPYKAMKFTDTISLSDAFAIVFRALGFADSISLSDAFTLFQEKEFADSITASDAFAIIFKGLEFTDTVSIADAFTILYKEMKFADSISLSDAFAVIFRELGFSDAVGMADAFAIVFKTLGFSDTISASDAFIILKELFFEEAISVSDAFTITFKALGFADTIGLSDAFAIVFKELGFSDTVSLADVFTEIIKMMPFADAISLSDAFEKEILGAVAKEFSDSISMSDAYAIVLKALKFSDTIGLADAFASLYKEMKFADTITVADVFQIVYKALSFSDSIGISDAFTLALVLISFDDSVSISDAFAIPFKAMDFADSMSLNDVFAIVFRAMEFTDTISLSDAFAIVLKAMDFTDTISIADAYEKTIVGWLEKNFADSISAVDAFAVPYRELSFQEAIQVLDSFNVLLSKAFADAFSLADAFSKTSGYVITLPKVLVTTEGKILINIGTKTLIVSGDTVIKTKDLKLQEI